jgi:Uma2 family endonuclease
LKRKRYEHFGVREYWLVDPDFNTIEILGFKDGQFHRVNFATRPSSVTSSLFPGLTLDLAWLLK